jgi:hypothetical protein
VSRAGGLESESAYPYTSYYDTTGTCQKLSSKVVTLKSFYKIQTEANMAAYLQSTGPLSVCVDAASWSSYTGGVLSVCGSDIDHCVQAVGVLPNKSGYWKIRNSWGTDWVSFIKFTKIIFKKKITKIKQKYVINNKAVFYILYDFFLIFFRGKMATSDFRMGRIPAT